MLLWPVLLTAALFASGLPKVVTGQDMGLVKWGQSCRPLSLLARWASGLAQEQDMVGTHPTTGMEVSSIYLMVADPFTR